MKNIKNFLTESKKVKKLEDYTKSDLEKLRKQIKLNSIYFSDYYNNLGIEEKSCADFFNGYMDYLWKLAEEEYDEEKFKDLDDSDVISKFDNIDNLVAWWNCYDDFSWVTYDETMLDD